MPAVNVRAAPAGSGLGVGAQIGLGAFTVLSYVAILPASNLWITVVCGAAGWSAFFTS